MPDKNPFPSSIIFLRIGFLGTGSSSSKGQRLNTSLVIQTSEGNLLIDCSGTPEYALAKQNIDILKVNNLFITHAHIDHIYALPSFIHSQRILSLPNRPPPLNIFSLPQTLSIAKELINSFKLLHKDPPLYINFIPLSPPGKVKIAALNLEFFLVNHGNHPTLGVLLQSSKKNLQILYSSDGKVSENILKRINKNTILIHECCGFENQKDHTSASLLMDSLKNNVPRKLILVHLPHLNPSDEKKIKMIFKPYTSIMIPKDNDSLNL